jgi:hypothetical protein
VLRITAGIDPRPVLSSYLGVFLVGAMFLALGLFVSGLVRSQMVAAARCRWCCACRSSFPASGGRRWTPGT